MNCSAARLAISQSLDFPLDADLQSALERHLRSCAACAAGMADLRTITSALRTLERPAFPASLRTAVLADLQAASSMDRSRAGEAFAARTRTLVTTHARTVANLASFVITATFYLLLLGYLKPVPVWTVPGRVEPISLHRTELSVLDPPAYAAGDSRVTFPRIVSASGLEESLRKAAPQTVVLVTLVHPDGRASVVEVLSPRDRPDLVERLSAAIQDISFRPATTLGRPVTTQLILRVERVDVRG